VAAEKRLARKVDGDEKLLRVALADIASCRKVARREAGHLDHFEVGLRRMLSVAHRVQFARGLNQGMPAAAARRSLKNVRTELLKTKDLYAKVWLRHNKRENIDVSLAVFDRVERSLAEALDRPIAASGGDFLPLGLEKWYNRNFRDVGGVPIGEAVVNGVPFRFAGLGRTHLALAGEGKSITLRLPEAAALRDLHLIMTSPRPADWPCPVCRVEWLRRGRAVYGEDLLSVRHLCDWWAPRGEHIWAGGGFRYVDPMRVRYALSPGYLYGLMHVSGFPITGTPRVDAVRLTSLADRELQLFAVTVEAVR
jgi:hypothetical protein